jgi:hypothetical protein
MGHGDPFFNTAMQLLFGEFQLLVVNAALAQSRLSGCLFARLFI